MQSSYRRFSYKPTGLGPTLILLKSNFVLSIFLPDLSFYDIQLRQEISPIELCTFVKDAGQHFLVRYSLRFTLTSTTPRKSCFRRDASNPTRNRPHKGQPEVQHRRHNWEHLLRYCTKTAANFLLDRGKKCFRNASPVTHPHIRGLLPYIGHIGMCATQGFGFFITVLLKNS